MNPPNGSTRLLTADDYATNARVPADHRLAYGPDPQQFADLYLPKGGADASARNPVVVTIHGGCWRAAYGLEPMGVLCAALREEGFAVLSLEYRRVGTGGGWPTTFQDVAAGADLLYDVASDFSLDLSRVVTMGHSAGGHLALWLAGRHRLPEESLLYGPRALTVHGVVALASIPDLVEGVKRDICTGGCSDLVGGLPEEVPDRYRLASPAALLPLGVPHRHFVGAQDHVVSAEYLGLFVAEAVLRGDNATLVELPGVGHFEVVMPTSVVWPLVRAATLELVLRV